MKLQIRRSTTYFSVSLIIGVLFAVFGIMALHSLNRPAFADNLRGRLITVHDRGQETAFVSDKSTLREAFADQGIAIDEHDAVEPGLDESLVAADYQVNIYRARPVIIIDGALRQQVVTPYQSPERIAKDAGVTLFPEDVATLSRSDDIMHDGAGLQLAIDRATLISLDLYGTVTPIRTQAVTVGDMLKEKNIILGDSGRVSVAASTPVTSGMEVRVWREGKQTITTEEDVNFSIKKIQDADQPIGYVKVETPGVKGKRTVTYEIDIQDGKEVARQEIASITLQEAVEQVEIIGTKPKSLPYTGGGTKTDWLAASIIAPEDWGYADFMVTRESGWNPNAVNRSSGACGLAQALPCSKLGPNWSDPVVALNWMDGYVKGRYGGWEGAYNFWVIKRWY